MDLSRALTLGFWKKVLRWSAISLVLYALFGFFVLPYVLKSVLASQLTQRLHREATIQAVSFNPFRLTLQVNDFVLKERNGTDPFVSFTELALNLEAVSVWRRGPIVRDVLLKTLRVSVIRNEDLSYNFSDLLTEFTAKPEPPPPPPPPSKPLPFSISNIRLEDSGVDFDDRPKHAQHSIRDLNLSIPFLSNLPYAIDVYTQPAFAVKVNGTPIELTGRSKPFSDSHETALDVNINNVELAKYLEYVPADLRFKMNSGSLDTALALSFSQAKDRPPALLVNGKIGLKQLAVTDLEGHPLVSLPLLDVPVDSLDVFGHKVTLGTILLQEPEVHLQLDKAGVLNLTTLVGEQKSAGASGETVKSEKAVGTEPEAGQKTEPGLVEAERPETKKLAEAGPEGEKVEEKKPESTPTIVDIAEIRVTEGKVTFVDETHEKPFQTAFDHINVSVRQVSTDAAKPIALEVACKSDAGEVIQHSGTVLREPLKAEGSISLQQIALNQYAPYYAKQILFDIVDGKIDVATKFVYAKGPDNTPSIQLSGLAATLSALRLHKPSEKEDFLKIPVLMVKDAALDVAKQTVTVGEVITNKGALQVRRDSNGALNLVSLTPTSSPASSSPVVPQPKLSTPQPRGKKSAKVAKPQAPPETAAPTWLINVKKFSLDQYAVRFDDQTLSQPVTTSIDPLSISLEDFSTEKNSKAKTALRATLNKSGTLAVDGPLSLSPLAATFKINSKDIDLLPFRPYFADKVKITLTSGAASVEGNLGLQSVGTDNLNVTYAGQVGVTKFATITKTTSEDFLKWKSLSMTGLNVGTAPLHVDIGEVALADFYSRLTINPDTTFNVQGIMVEQPSAAQPVATQPPANASPSSGGTAGGSTPITIAKVSLKGGTVNFSDHYVKPNYSAKLTDLGGRVTGLTSKVDSPADVNLRGSLDNAAPLEITGKLNPFGKDLFVDLGVDFKDIDLNPMTPYAGKYAGYAIEKGKLTLNLKYQIANRQLKAENKVFIDQFTFGESINSPTATSLPVKLAVSLLKDRNGAIYLDLPLSGSLDDPQFSVWGTIVEIVTNLLIKAATAPFALIGAVLGGGGGSGEEMNQIEFAYGRTTLDESAQEKMKKISEALVDRSSLSLEIAGYAEKDKDLDGLKMYRFERKLKAQKLNDTGKAEAEGASLDEVTIEPEEYLKYLTMAYKKESFPKPRNMLGLVKDLPQEEMETLMFAHIEITEGDVQELAGQRAMAVRDYLLKTGQLEAGRLFLVEPASIFAARKGAGKGSRVELAMK